MPDESDKLTPEQDALAEALVRLEPAPARLDRDRLMFAAGAESRRNTIRLWQLTAGFFAALGFTAGVLLYSNTTSPFDRSVPPPKTSPTTR